MTFTCALVFFFFHHSPSSSQSLFFVFISLKLVVCHFFNLLYLQCVWEEISLHSILTLNITSLQSNYAQYLIQKSGQMKYYIYRRYNKCSDPLFITLWNHHWQHYSFCVHPPRYHFSVPRSSLKNHQALLRSSALVVFVCLQVVFIRLTTGPHEDSDFFLKPIQHCLYSVISSTETWFHVQKHEIFLQGYGSACETKPSPWHTASIVLHRNRPELNNWWTVVSFSPDVMFQKSHICLIRPENLLCHAAQLANFCLAVVWYISSDFHLAPCYGSWALAWSMPLLPIYLLRL